MSICENFLKIKQIAKAVKNLKEPILKLAETGSAADAKELYAKLDKAYQDFENIREEIKEFEKNYEKEVKTLLKKWDSRINDFNSYIDRETKKCAVAENIITGLQPRYFPNLIRRVLGEVKGSYINTDKLERVEKFIPGDYFQSAKSLNSIDFVLDISLLKNSINTAEKFFKAFPNLKRIGKGGDGVSVILHTNQTKIAKVLEKIKKGIKSIPELTDKKGQRIITDLVIEGEIKVRS